jgi:flavodoxin
MKTLVVYYSRTGTTKKVAENIAFWLKAKKEEIIDQKNRKGPLGYIMGGKDASTKQLTDISAREWDISEFNRVVIGTPVWAWTMAPAIRTYIELNKDILKDKELCFFCTMGATGDRQTFEEMEKIIGRKPKAVLTLKTRDIVQTNYENAIREFVKRL